MFSKYIAAALARAEYDVIDNPEPHYIHVPGLNGVWATGKTFDDCRKSLIETIVEWIATAPCFFQLCSWTSGQLQFIESRSIEQVDLSSSFNNIFDEVWTDPNLFFHLAGDITYAYIAPRQSSDLFDNSIVYGHNLEIE